MLLRSTWLKPNYLTNKLEFKVKIVFFIGSSVDPDLQQAVAFENEIYRDVVQSSFLDHYHNNTYKAISYLKYVSRLIRRLEVKFALIEKQPEQCKSTQL